MDTFEKIVQLSEERPITPSSLFLVGQLLGKSRFIEKYNTMKVDGKRSQSQIKNGDILLSYIGHRAFDSPCREHVRLVPARQKYRRSYAGVAPVRQYY